MNAYVELCERAKRVPQHVELAAKPAERNARGVITKDGYLTELRLVNVGGAQAASVQWQGSADATALALREVA